MSSREDFQYMYIYLYYNYCHIDVPRVSSGPYVNPKTKGHEFQNFGIGFHDHHNHAFYLFLSI